MIGNHPTIAERAQRLGISVEDFGEVYAAAMRVGKPVAPARRRRSRPRASQADIGRAIRAAKKNGAGSVQMMPDGTIRIDVQPEAMSQKINDHDRPPL
jgi:hypothetical protein